MQGAEPLTEREDQILEAVIRMFVETAAPVGSRTVTRRFPLGVSAATVRNTMADLEEKGFLGHPHTSAGRVPMDPAYRYYVDTLMEPVRLSAAERDQLRSELAEGERGALARLIHRAAQALGMLTGELGVAAVPRLDDAVLDALELVSVSDEKVLLVLKLSNGVVRTVYVDVPVSVPPETLVSITLPLNERLAGQTLREIRETLAERLRGIAPTSDDPATELLDIVIESGDELFRWSRTGEDALLLGRTSVLANQPEFASGRQLKNLIELTERRDLLASVLDSRDHDATLEITIGAEHRYPELTPFTVVTSEYRVGNLGGVIGVIGPTRMPYEKVVAIVNSAGAVVSDLLGPAAS